MSARLYKCVPRSVSKIKSVREKTNVTLEFRIKFQNRKQRREEANVNNNNLRLN